MGTSLFPEMKLIPADTPQFSSLLVGLLASSSTGRCSAPLGTLITVISTELRCMPAMRWVFPASEHEAPPTGDSNIGLCTSPPFGG
jgi:hypothetical protein